jgi:hypothetical protein
MFTRPFSWTITALLLTGVAACAQLEYPKAIVDEADMEKAIALAKELDRRKDQPPPEGTSWFEIKRGTLPAVITAPHATEPFREGQFRFSDGGGTGGLADALNAICDVTVVYTTYRSPSDPNFYDDNEFKVSLGELISEIKPDLLLDVHASHPYRPYDVDLGTMNGRSVLGDTFLIRALIDAFSMEGILSISVDWFAASKNQTVIKYAALKGVPSVQLEFSATRTTPGDDALAAHRFAQTVQALARFLGTRGLCARVNSRNVNK